MSSTHSPQTHVEDPDAGWKPNNRPQSTVARNFMSELDDLFRLDGGIDLLDKNVHQKKQAVTTHAQELEALEAKLRETEARLNQARNSPPRRKDSQRRTPIEDTFSAQDRVRLENGGSPLPVRQNKENMAPPPRQNMPGALSEPTHSDNSTEYVFVDRPPTARTDDGAKA
ncbi:uncharacterized protein N0V89_003944 [Didymosphaeria variabile]|uniref:Uncharacterized protein n=1 Tax=Didymosphaeria variabile TaxID=1932322 RepID=A0A9W8XPB6_9PLEO|nr:uncharacterized protein N0V89_003944 [Didymosphaeria variabile]KAJ4355919.1 hypothetical protein N0V89_003944 [Didymosphaeria variabile]